MSIRNNKIVKNASWIIICKVINALLGLVVSMFTARYLGPSNSGLINYAASLVAFVSPIMLLGINEILVAEIVSDPENAGEILGSSIIMCLFSAALCVTGIWAFVRITSRTETETLYVCLLYSLILFCQAAELIQYWFQAKLLSKYSSIIGLIAYVCISGYRVFLLITQKSIYWFAIANALDTIIIAIVLILLYNKLADQKLSFSFVRCKKLFNSGKYYIISNLMLVVFAQTDRIMLKIMINDAANGFYSAAVHCANVTAFAFAAIVNSARPVVFESKLISDEKFERSIVRLYSVIIYLSVIQGVFTTIFAKILIHVLYGDAYMASVQALQIIVWYTSFSYIGGIRNIWILAEKKQRLIIWINLTGAIVNVVLNWILIPTMGVNGAAIASLVTQGFMNVILGFIIPGIRRNNELIIQSLNPKVWIEIIKK